MQSIEPNGDGESAVASGNQPRFITTRRLTSTYFSTNRFNHSFILLNGRRQTVSNGIVNASKRHNMKIELELSPSRRITAHWSETSSTWAC